MELPDLKGREAILKVHGQNVKMSDDVDYNAIARATAGASGAELANIINEAALRAVRMGRSAVVQADLEESVETVIAGYQKKNAVISQKERRIVAYHEVGHALVAACQSHSAPGNDLTIGSSGDKVRQMQEQLDEIATVYTAIPRVTPDGIYGTRTANAVREFQSIFGLPQTGVVDFATWYKISHIYVGITRGAEIIQIKTKAFPCHFLHYHSHIIHILQQDPFRNLNLQFIRGDDFYYVP